MYEDFIAIRIAKLRDSKNVSARDMSLSIGQNRNFINQIENEKSLPSMQSFFYICEYFNITPKDFFDDEIKNPLVINNLLVHLKHLSDKQIDTITELVKNMN